MIGRRHTSALMLLAHMLWPASAALAQEPASPCGPLRPPGQYGPYDYRKDPDKLPIVLGNHFTPEVEMLIRGKAGHIGADIDYTLRAIPNFPRALIAMMNLGEKVKTEQPVGANYSVECYFERAIRFQPDDQVVRMIYSTYLSKRSRMDEAKVQLGVVEGLAADNPLTHYNLGLLYFDIKDYEKSLKHAHIAHQLGIVQPGLKDKLAKAGQWSEPAAPQAPGLASEAASEPAAAPSEPRK